MPGLPAIGNPDDFGPAPRPIAAPVAVVRRESSARRRIADETFMLGRYLVTGRIASGGMATVYSARLEGQGGFAREFALKVIHPHLAAADGFKDRFLDEARIASRVSHPNVVATVDSDQDHGYHYLVLGLVDGVTLRQLQVNDLHRSTTTEGTRLNPGEAARVVCDAARGLHAVHSVVDDEGEPLNVVHRDLSPHNLMLDTTGRTVLIDLGLAKARGQLGHTQTGVLCGKLPYMSPEQSRLAPLDARSDVFSLGSVLFELAVGEPPFGDDHTPGTLDKLRVADSDRLARLLVDADVPRWLTQVILGCLRREPADRYPSAEVVAESLDQAMRRAGISQAEVCEHLARRARSVRDQLGPVAPADPLPPLISPDPTGSHRSLPISRIPGWARGLGMAAAGALVVLVVMSAFGPFSQRFGQRGTDAQERGLLPGVAGERDSDDEPTAGPEQTTETPRDPSAARDSSGVDEPVADTAAGVEPEPRLEPARKRRSEAKRSVNLSGFKSNPYD